MKLVPGIVSDEDQEEDKLKQVCLDFGRKMAAKLKAQ
jgi:ribosomal protein L18E